MGLYYRFFLDLSMAFLSFSKNHNVKNPPRKIPNTKYHRMTPLHIRNISEKIYKPANIQKIKSSIDIQNNECFTILRNRRITQYTKHTKFPARQAERKIAISVPIPSIYLNNFKKKFSPFLLLCCTSE